MNPPLSRRSFLVSSAATAALACVPLRAADRPRKKIALIGTVVRPLSHAQHFIERFLLGYAWEGGWRRPDVDLVSLYIDQFPENDLARATAQRHDVRSSPPSPRRSRSAPGSWRWTACSSSASTAHIPKTKWARHVTPATSSSRRW